jgi:hypothetical protein
MKVWTGYDHPDRGRTDPGNPLEAKPGEPTMDQAARASVQMGERSMSLLKAGQYQAAAGALLQSVARATTHLSDEQAAGVIRAYRAPGGPMADPGDSHPTGPATPEPTTADRARDGLAVLAHPLAWQPGGAR